MVRVGGALDMLDAVNFANLTSPFSFSACQPIFCFAGTCSNDNVVIYGATTIYAHVVTNFGCNRTSESIEEVVR